VAEWFFEGREEALRPDSEKFLDKTEGCANTARFGRRSFLAGGLAAVVVAGDKSSLGQVPAVLPRTMDGPLTIDAVELMELHGRYTEEAGVDGQAQVNPLDVYDDFRPQPYKDQPSGSKVVQTSAIYLHIRTAAGVDGLYGPIEKSAAIVVHIELRPFLVGKDALAGEALWDQMYRSNRHSRDGFFMMAISAVDNTLWDLRGSIMACLSTVCWEGRPVRRWRCTRVASGFLLSLRKSAFALSHCSAKGIAIRSGSWDTVRARVPRVCGKTWNWSAF
jgi:hypothetical protein